MKKKLFLLPALIAALALPAVVGAVEINGLSIHGFISQGYLKSDENNYLAETKDGTFEFNETAINFSLSPIENLRLGMQFMSRDLGPTRNNDVYMDWGYADYRFADAFGIRVGKVKVPIGLYNQTRDVDFLRTFIWQPQGVYDEGMRDVKDSYEGGSVYGDFGIGSLGDVEYEFAGGTANLDINTPYFVKIASSLDPSGGGSTGSGTYMKVNWSLVPSVRWNTPIEGLRLGTSCLFSDLDMGSNYTFGTIAVRVNAATTINYSPIYSVEYVWNNLKLAAEYRQLNGDIDISFNGTTYAEVEVKSEAYYGLVSYQFFDWLELGTYYSVYYADRDDRDGSGLEAGGTPDYFAWQKDWAVAAKFNLNESITLKLETHFIDGAAQLYASENPDGIKDNMVLYAVKCSYNF